jgi:hypothetical protein
MLEINNTLNKMRLKSGNSYQSSTDTLFVLTGSARIITNRNGAVQQLTVPDSGA